MVFINAVFALFSLLWLVSEIADAEVDPPLWFALAFTLLCLTNIVNLLGRSGRKPKRKQSQPKPTGSRDQPLAERPEVPEAYGVLSTSEGLLAWPDVSRRLADPPNYWLCTTRPDGRPHVAPVWGVWMDEAFYFGTHRDSQKARNLAAAPYLSLHLDSSDEVVIVEGPVEEVGDPQARALVDQAMAGKYELEPDISSEDPNPVFRLRPRLAFAWSDDDFSASATRWTF